MTQVHLGYAVVRKATGEILKRWQAWPTKLQDPDSKTIVVLTDKSWAEQWETAELKLVEWVIEDPGAPGPEYAATDPDPHYDDKTQLVTSTRAWTRRASWPVSAVTILRRIRAEDNGKAIIQGWFQSDPDELLEAVAGGVVASDEAGIRARLALLALDADVILAPDADAERG